MPLHFHRLAIIPLIAMGTSALAQDQGDWEFRNDPLARLTYAALPTTTGITIAVRCVDGGLQAFMTGLPPIDAEERQIGIGFGDKPIRDQTWNVAINDTVAVSQLPAPLARNLRDGGQMHIRFEGAAEDGRNLRYIVDLPPSPSAIDQTLTACGRPLIDPRDAQLDDLGDDGIPTDLNWLRRPRPRYPSNQRYVKGFAVVTCIVGRDGGLNDCVVETEHPRDGGFGAATLDATRNGRLTNTLSPGAEITPSQVMFTVNYYMSGYNPRSHRAPLTGSRLHPSSLNTAIAD